MRSPAPQNQRRARVPGRQVARLLLCTAVAVCVYLLGRHHAKSAAGANSTVIRALNHSPAGNLLDAGGLSADVDAKVKSGVGGIFFGDGAVGVHEEAKDPERVFGHASGALSAAGEAVGEKVRPLGFYFRKDIPKALKHRDAALGLPPEDAEDTSSLQHLRAVAKHKASKGAAGDTGLGFYFSKDARNIAEDVEAKPKARRLVAVRLLRRLRR